MMTTPLDHVRREFAEMLRREVGLRSAGLVRAFGTVPRERFVGPGPWQILVQIDPMLYRETPDDDPRHLYANVLVALDASRQLNNGQPAALARWLDDLELTPGECVLHLGCGVGYYTAIVAEAVSPGGSVVGVEVDAGLAERARRNLEPYANVTVVCDDGSQLAAGAFDAIFVNAGATEVLPRWTEQLRAGGRLLVPLTVGLPGMNVGLGHLLLVAQRSSGCVARFVSPIGVFHCVGARSAEGEELLRESYARHDEGTVRSLRQDEHRRSEDCWLHGAHFCLSRLAVDEGGETRSTPMIIGAVPVIAVSDSDRAEHYYGRVLGFATTSAYRPSPDVRDPAYLTLVRDDVSLHLQSFKPGRAGMTDAFLWVADVDRLYADIVARGAVVQLPPTNQTWGTRETAIRDPDGNVLVFAASLTPAT